MVPGRPVFEGGRAWEFQVSVPKRGFVGAPFSPSGAPPWGPPRSQEDYDQFLVRATVVGTRALQNGHRMVVRVDKMDKFHRLSMKGIYYGYIDMLATGARVICKYTDDGYGDEETGVRYGVPFPFYGARPPAIGFAKGSRNGYMTETGLGFDYTLLQTNSSGATIQVNAVRFQKAGATADNLPRTTRFYGPEIAEVAKTNATTQILFRETQEWAKPDDWLWQKMERFDNEGHLLMRCVQIKPKQ